VFIRLAVILALTLTLGLPFGATSHAQSIEMVPLDAPNILDTNQQNILSPDEEEMGGKMGEETVILADDAPQASDETMEVFPAVRLRALDKITARTVSFDVNVGETVKFGDVYIRPQTCKEPPPIEEPESLAFLQIWEKTPENKSKWIFSGWMFASSPGLSAMDHPVYDVWVLDCVDTNDIKPAVSEDAQSEE